MEQFKNLMQIMLWMHNRLDLTGLEAIRTDIVTSYNRGSIDSYEAELLKSVRCLYAMDCAKQLEKKQEEAAHASMA